MRPGLANLTHILIHNLLPLALEPLTMATYREQLEYVEGLRIKEGVATRYDCPFCGGRNTFGLTHLGSEVTWHCFRASCDVRGVKGVEGSATYIKDRLAKGQDAARPGRYVRPLPSVLSSIGNHPRALDYVLANHAMEAFTVGDIRLSYSPADDRVLFHDPSSNFAIGRALGKRKPRWMKYGEPPAMFSIGSGSIGVLVEDAASACAVSQIENIRGCALLGTVLTASHKDWLIKHLTRVIVCLDKDASSKSLGIKRRLESRIETSVLFLEDDFKNMSVKATTDLLQKGMGK